MPPEYNTPEDEPFVSIEDDDDEFLEEQPAPRKAVSCWMAVILIIVAACLLMRVFCFNLLVFDFRPIPLH
ncbi:hypothetical protein JR338_12150 [Chloroflexota bacterium]|nr:hypothetical protein JR338_12150 [Chloroflexota bacterium]